MNETCEHVRGMLHLLLEGETRRSERRDIEEHLERCTDCAREMEWERSLSALLDPHWTRRGARRPLVAAAFGLVPAGVLLSVVIAFSWMLQGPAAYGSIAPMQFLPSLALENGESLPLRAHNHLAVGPQEVKTIQIEGEGTLRIVGPAVIELDRTEDGWKLVLLRGQVEIELVDGARMEITSVHGQRWLGAGGYVARLDPDWFLRWAGAGGEAATQDTGTSPSELLARAHGQFIGADYPAAELTYRAVREHPDASADEARQAHFYQLAAVGNQDRPEDALALGEAYLVAYPEDESATYVLYFQGVYLSRLGRAEEAREAWETILSRDPDSELAEHARSALETPPRTAPPERPPADASGRARPIPPAGESAAKTLVVSFDLAGEDSESRRFRDVASAVARFHHAERLELASGELAHLEQELRARLPLAVIFVLPPQSLDVQLHRRLLLLSARLDEDVFPDFAFGYLTASDGTGLEGLWKRTLAVHADGLSSRHWLSLFVTGSDASMTYPAYQSGIAAAAGFQGEGYAIAVHEKDPKCLEYAAEVLPRLSDAGVLKITGNGDPQGIWLFDDHRNVDASKHWPYDPERVGVDPEGSMPRLLAADFAKLHLSRPVVWSGTCHSAATQRVWVEGDIVSTFGVTERATVHELALEESLGLSILGAGAVALLAPIGANHGYSVEMETEFALAHAATLGETIKSTWDDVFLQAEGELRLHLPEPGDPHDHYAEPIMQGGGANRALIGDPTLRPFEAAVHPSETVRVEKAGADGFDVVVSWLAGFHPRAWDIYGTDRTRDFRVVARVPLDELLPEDALSLSATLELTGEDGESIPRALLRHVEIEAWHGERFLHLQANAPRELLDGKPVQARFHVRLDRGER